MISPVLLSYSVIVYIDSVTDYSHGEQYWQIVCVSCFHFWVSWHDAVDIGCIDWTIIATLETAGIRGVGIGGASVNVLL